MIQKLRRRFIIIAMSSVAIVLGIILALVVGFNYNKAYYYADEVINVLVENNGSFSNFEYKEIPVIGKRPLPNLISDNPITQETRFETRYISIKFENEHPIVVEKAIMALSDDKAIEMAAEVIKNESKSGVIDNYRYKVDETNTLVVFVDNTRNLMIARNTFRVCVVCYFSALLFIFILVFALSKLFISPSVKSYTKQKSFITDAGHELKTPLTIISANNELLEMEFGENESTNAISKQVEKMTTMVKNLTALATLDEENKKASFNIFSISDALHDVSNSFVPLLSSNNRKFDIEIEENIDYNGNESLIRELFNVLLENANKYSLTFTRISLKKIKNNIYINCINDANNISDGNNDMCFERFYRSAEARKISGSGIGLSIAKEIVEAHKGKIHAIGLLKNNTFEIEIVL